MMDMTTTTPKVLVTEAKTIGGGLDAAIVRRWKGHMVRVIATKELPHGKGYPGDVLAVKAGYARNYLIPQKLAVYATRQNFFQLNIKDPELETPEEKRARLVAEDQLDQDQDLKAADILRKYLRNKVVRFCC
jgi:hypothetical protein